MRTAALVRWPLCVLLLGALAVASMLYAQRRSVDALHENVDRLRRLKKFSAPPPSPPNPPSVEIRQKEQALADLRAHIAAAQQAAVAPVDAPLPNFGWRPKGFESATAALESALCAASSGDVAALATSLTMSPYLAAKADLNFRRLPAENREEFGSAEMMVATLTATMLPMEVLSASPIAGDMNRAQATLDFIRNGQNRTLHLDLRRTPAGWRLIVPETAVNLSRQLAAKAPR